MASFSFLKMLAVELEATTGDKGSGLQVVSTCVVAAQTARKGGRLEKWEKWEGLPFQVNSLRVALPTLKLPGEPCGTSTRV